MGPKRKASDSAKSAKRTKVVMSLADKVKVLDKLREGKSFAAVGRLFNKNESTIRSLEKHEEEIRRAVITSTDSASKTTHQVRDKIVVKMEKALFIWLEDSHQNGLPVDSNMIREKAKHLYSRIKGNAEEDAGEGTSASTS